METIIYEIGRYKPRKRLMSQYFWLGATTILLCLVVGLINGFGFGQYVTVFGYSYADLPQTIQDGLFFFFLGLWSSSFFVAIWLRSMTTQVRPIDAMRMMEDISEEDTEMLKVVERIKAQDRLPTLRELSMIEAHIARQQWFDAKPLMAKA